MQIGALVFAQVEENFMYNARTITFAQIQALIATAEPTLLSSDLNTKAQEKGT